MYYVDNFCHSLYLYFILKWYSNGFSFDVKPFVQSARLLHTIYYIYAACCWTASYTKFIKKLSIKKLLAKNYLVYVCEKINRFKV